MAAHGSAAGGDPGDGTRSSQVAELVDEVARLAASRDREDLAERLAEGRRRVGRSDTVVCVVGEFKQGKSALINALLETDACPVDDDLATMAVTVVRWADAPAATVRRRDEGSVVVEAIDPAALPDWVTERGNPENHLAVELVEVGLPDPFLAGGLTLVDTPGVGGLNAAHAAATLAFLPMADALVFVTDASAELTAAELDFLARARSAGPPVLVALTKTDMYPHWRRILEIDTERLAAAGLDAPPFPVSSTLRSASRRAAAASPSVARDESGFEPFEAALRGEVAERARDVAAAAAASEIRAAIDQLRDPVAAELEALDDPAAAARLAAELRDVRDRLARLADAGADWSTRLEDEFEALRTRTSFELNDALRRTLRAATDEVESIDPGRSWPEFSQRVQQDVATAVRAAFVATTDGAGRIGHTVAELLADEDVELDAASGELAVDTAALWKGGQTFGGAVQATAVAGLGLLGGATVGVEMLGMLGALLGTALVGPALLGAALVFGGRGVVSERRRQLTERRQQARTFVADFVENVRFEADGRLASLGRELQRQLRARFADRIRELRRTYEETAEALERAAQEREAGAGQRRAELRAELSRVEALAARAADLDPSRG